ncbi:MAG: DUF2135 domain-containing protein [Planctomycetota bacterium]|nr:DUF2135 domain-containing protein [Planctomycetota bacterium]
MTPRRLILFAAAALWLVVPLADAPAGEPARGPAVTPELEITSPRGGQTKERVVTIAGTSKGLVGDRLTLVFNGVPLSIPNEGDAFSSRQVLAPGWNSIRVVGKTKTGVLEDELAVYARVPRKDLRITLTWDTPATDIDLWVTGPDGQLVNYQNKQGKAGGVLDVDVTNGFGPETYTQARLQPGTYRVQANYYGGDVPTRATLTVIRGEGTPEASRATYRAILLKRKDRVDIAEFTVSR